MLGLRGGSVSLTIGRAVEEDMPEIIDVTVEAFWTEVGDKSRAGEKFQITIMENQSFSHSKKLIKFHGWKNVGASKYKEVGLSKLRENFKASPSPYVNHYNYRPLLLL